MTSADGCPSLYTKMMHKIKTQKSQLIFILKVMFSADYIEAENAQYADIHLNLRKKMIFVIGHLRFGAGFLYKFLLVDR